MKLLCLTFLTVLTFNTAASSSNPQLRFNTVSQAVEVSFPAPRGLHSDLWRPAIYSTCFPGLHNDSAPCRRVPNLIYGEELVYPDFRIRLPRFVNAEQRRLYLKLLHLQRHVWLRGRIIDQQAYFLNQRGQNLLYSNVTYAGKPAAGQWGNAACMSYGSHLHVGSFPPWDASHANGRVTPAALFAASPDDFSFQHFLDRVAILLAQTRHLSVSDYEWRYFTSTNDLEPVVFELWSMLVQGFNSTTSLLNSYSHHPGMRLFLYPCQAPLVHPYTHQLVSELLQQAAGFDPRVIEPIAARRTVLFLARQGPRQWNNEGECRLAIERLLEERGVGEELHVFDSGSYKSVKEVVALGRRVKLMVGVHGGAFYNLVFMQPGTGLVEVCPVITDPPNSRCGTAFWEMSAVRNMHYWNVIVRNVSGTWEVRHVDCGLVVRAVRGALEKLEVLPSPLEAFHQGSSFE